MSQPKFISPAVQRTVADIRGCMNASPNTASAASYAVELGYDSIYLSALYHDKDPNERPTIFLISPFVDDYKSLMDMSYEEWFMGPCRDMQLPIPDGLSDLSLIPGLREIWVEFLKPNLAPDDYLSTAWHLAVKSLPPELQLRLYSDDVPANLPPGAKGGDPTGILGFKLLSRPSNLLDEMALDKKITSIIPNSISFDGHPLAEVTIIPLP